MHGGSLKLSGILTRKEVEVYVNVKQSARLERTVFLTDKVPSAELRERMGIGV